jgi:mannitol-specific phosphotransferase system IIBC component
MKKHRPMAFAYALSFVMAAFVQIASAQTQERKATAPEKMMPVEKAQKMRECERRAEQQKIKMEDRARFVNECIARAE